VGPSASVFYSPSLRAGLNWNTAIEEMPGGLALRASVDAGRRGDGSERELEHGTGAFVLCPTQCPVYYHTFLYVEYICGPQVKPNSPRDNPKEAES
jgi:hypothetical protein